MTARLEVAAPFLSTIARIRLHRDHVQGLPLFTGEDARVCLLLAEPKGDREPVRRLEVKTPGLGKYGKLSDARNG